MQKFSEHLQEQCLTVNLDPAVFHVPYVTTIDIRNSINYKDVMHKYNLGPNGGIMTCLNLFTTKMSEIISSIEGKKPKYAIFDTPGQIEVFTWSASGTIITESLASIFPTIILYIIDIPAVQSHQTFMSNMLYACSILYKMRLPFIIVFNKSDLESGEQAKLWMTDYEAFHKALAEDDSYSSNLMYSLSLVLDDFYKVIQSVEVSSKTGFGLEQLLDKIPSAITEYTEYFKQRQNQKTSHETQIPNLSES